MKLPVWLLLVLLSFTPVYAHADESADIAAIRANAEKGDAQAQLELGKAFSEGIGSWKLDATGSVAWTAPANVNYTEAYFWLSLAVNNKVADAAPALYDVALHMTPAEIVAANIRVKQWTGKLASLSLPRGKT